MGSSLFILLFLLGVILSLLGGLIGIVDAFKVSPFWGLLTLLIPFALLIFCIKFWERRRWARNSLILGLLGLLSMVIGMPFLQGLLSRRVATGNQPAESFPVKQMPVSGAKPGEEIFAEPLVPAAPGFAAIAQANLIQSTDPDERRRLVNSSRPDPFATVPIPPPPRIIPNSTPVVVPGPVKGPVAPSTQRPGPPIPSPGAGAKPSTAGISTASPGAAPGIDDNTDMVTLQPSPALQAEQVQVTGVIALGGYRYAIVQSPEQPGGQYIKVGQRFGEGNQILVKRIEIQDQEPIVILEEDGREVPRFVGPASKV
ncbi:MAG: hypothetical protein VKO01_03800 [Cyanobacteriota bacterium]|nr:hypothetical protein [Cyanobacteriota bacterium]